LGVRWYAGGPLARETVTNETSKATKLVRVEVGDFIYNRLFAWKGSFGVIAPSLAGSYVSGEFPAFRTDPASLLPEYLFLYMSRPGIWDQILLESTGSTATSRNRWKEDRFLSMPIDLPPVQGQRRIVDLISSIDAATVDGEAMLASTEMLLGASREEAWFSQVNSCLPLSEVATIEARMVDPTHDDYRDLFHVGVAQIEKDTGRLVEGKTAEEDGLISSKFLFTPEDIIYSKIRPNLRKVALPRFTGLCSADAYPLRPKPGADPDFLREMLLSEAFTRAAVAKSGRTKMPKVNRTELFSIDVPNPATEVQRANGEVFRAIRESREATGRVVEDLAALRGQLLDALISGEHEIPSSYDRFLKEAS